MTFLDGIFGENIHFENASYHFEMIESLMDFVRYKKIVHETFDAYNVKTKPNPKAVYWPNPTRDPDQSLYTTLPVIKNFGIVSSKTPIGSAGSCFAFEIASNLQKRGFNYVVAEKRYQPDVGVYEHSDNSSNPYAQSSANWGTLFNTPSFRQLAEKAFHTREFPQLLLHNKLENGVMYYSDPFREDMSFATPESYANDYEKHRNAIRQALTQCEVFIITLGLNECWELIKEKLAISRNPRHEALGVLVQHRILTVEENIKNIQTFIDIVRKHNPALKLIISVSPVPFMATGRSKDCHVMTANCHSKAVLRVAAEELVKNNRDVFYFPSYELATMGTKEPWTADQRHINAPTISRVMQLFDEMFVTI